MQGELFYSRIIKDTVTDGFKSSVNEVLIPLLEECDLGRGGILFFDDHIADGFLLDGMVYYPLTLRDTDGEATLWIRWPYNKKSFGITPFAYTGSEPLAFEIAEDVPEAFVAAMEGRRIAPADGAVRINVEAAHPDPTFLAGKYSMTFVTELAQQITERISETLAVSGLGASDVELQLVFAPGTYMEHTSEGVTYRRLLITAKGCQPRDFWVKWTSPSGVYHIQDRPRDITFDIGEGVPQKIREKEYRFLAGQNPDKYRAAMGKRTVTEWREIIKLSVKRGLLTKITAPEAEPKKEFIAPTAFVAPEQIITPVSEPTPAAEEIFDLADEGADEDNSFDDIMAMARAAIGEDAPATEEIFDLAEEDEGADEDNSFDDIMAMARAAIGEDAPATEEIFDLADEGEVEDNSFDDIMAMARAAIGEEAPAAEEIFDPGDEDEESEQSLLDSFLQNVMGDTAEEFEEETEEFEEEIEEAEEIEEEFEEIEEAEEEIEEAEEEAVSEESIRAEIEAKLRLEYEAKARAMAEAEAEKLRAEQERLRAEIARRNEETERLRAELEAGALREARERERLAEAARLAVEEQKKQEAERIEREAREREEARLRAEAEADRREQERKEAERIAEAARIKAEMDARRSPAEPAPKREESFISRKAKLMFRRPVDPAIAGQIQQIVERTLVAHGKSDIPIHMRAHLKDATTINLDIVKFPEAEGDLLVAILKALGNGNIGIAKIILE